MLRASDSTIGCDFNPRPPWGGRLRELTRHQHDLKEFQSTPSVGRATYTDEIIIRPFRFQSTPSVGRATHFLHSFLFLFKFQSTPSVGRATKNCYTDKEKRSYFNPRPPWGGRLKKIQKPKKQAKFQSTPSVGRATLLLKYIGAWISIFQSTPSVGRATIESKRTA